ncbi:nucleotide exchange factor GrpE [Isosphaeraceae bacterium EP7]
MADPIQNDTNDETQATGDVGALQRERDELIEQLQRSRADSANFQKRIRAQAEADQLYAMGPLALDLVSVLDNFDRAIDAARSAGASTIVDGLELVHKQMIAALGKHGIVPIPALGQPFDPNVHDAIMQQPDAHHPEGTVVGEMGKGYRIRDRVLRPSKVAVSVIPQA